MALNNFRSVNLKIDKADDYFISNQFAKDGDYNGRKLVVQVTNGGLIESQTGVALNLGWQHQKALNKGLDPFVVVDATQGIFEIAYPAEMMQTGNIIAVIQVIESGKITETRNFTIQVEASPIDEGAIVSENSFTVLQDALLKTNDWHGRFDKVEADYIAEAERVEAQYPVQLAEVNEQLAQNVPNPNLVDRLEKLIQYRGMYARVASDNSLRIGIGMSKENLTVVEYRFVHNADNLLLLRGVYSGTEDFSYLPDTTLNGTFNKGTERQFYTTEIGAKITFSFEGSKLFFKRRRESRGGMWKVTLSTGENCFVSCYSLVGDYKEDLIFSNLSDSMHYATAEFIGNDTNNPPSSSPSRGYFYQSTLGDRPFKQADVLPINESTAIESINSSSVPDYAIQGRKANTSTAYTWSPVHGTVTGVSVDVAVKIKIDGVIYSANAGELPVLGSAFKEIKNFELSQFFRVVNPNATLDGKLWEHNLTHILSSRNPYLTIQNQMKLLQNTEFALGYFGMLPSRQSTMDRLVLNNQTEYNPIPNTAQEDEYDASMTSCAFTGEYQSGLYHGVAIDISSNQEVYNIGRSIEPNLKGRISFRADDVAKVYFTSFRGGTALIGESFTSQNRICAVAGVQFPNVNMGI